MAKNWIEGAIKHPGAERKAAAKAGVSTHEYMEEHKHDSGTPGKRARLGLTFEGMTKSKTSGHGLRKKMYGKHSD